MAALIALAQSVQLTPHEALSGVFGSISLASWIFLLVRPPPAANVSNAPSVHHPLTRCRCPS